MPIRILTHTPPWVFAVFAILLALGVLQSRTRRLTPWRVTAVPLVMVALSLLGIWNAFGANPPAFAAWLAGVAAAFLVNLAAKQPRGVHVDGAAGVIVVPGSWIPLALMMCIFFARYAVNATAAMRPDLARLPAFAVAAGAAYGLLGGAFAARAWRVIAAARPA